MARANPLSPIFRRGDRVRIKLNSCYRHYLDGLEGTITCVLHHGAIVALDNDPAVQQRILDRPGKSTGRSTVGPKIPNQAQRVYQFHELEKIVP